MSKVLIAYIMDGKGGGIDRYILNLYDKIKDNHQVDFLTNTVNEDLKNNFAKKGSKVIWVPTLKNPISQYKCIRNAIEVGKYDTVYFNISTALMFLGPKAAKDANVKQIIIHSHSTGLDVQNKTKRIVELVLHNILKRKLSKYGTDFLACGKEAGKWLFRKGTNINLVNNAIDIDKFAFNLEKRNQIRKDLSINEDTLVILQMGNFVYQKNYEFTAEMFKEYEKHNSSAKLLLVGDGPLKEKIQNDLSNSNVIFTGQVSNPQDYLSAADIYIMPSHFEGLSVAAIEAQTNGLPCIFSNNISKDTDITSNCTFLPINNSKQWINQIQKLNQRKDTKDLIIQHGYSIKDQNLAELIK